MKDMDTDRCDNLNCEREGEEYPEVNVMSPAWPGHQDELDQGNEDNKILDVHENCKPKGFADFQTSGVVASVFVEPSFLMRSKVYARVK